MTIITILRKIIEKKVINDKILFYYHVYLLFLLFIYSCSYVYLLRTFFVVIPLFTHIFMLQF